MPNMRLSSFNNFNDINIAPKQDIVLLNKKLKEMEIQMKPNKVLRKIKEVKYLLLKKFKTEIRKLQRKKN